MMKILFMSALCGALLAIFLRQDDFLATVCFFLATYTSWDYSSSSLYMNYLTSRWEALPPIEATPIPEIRAQDFTRELFLSLTNNLKTPVVIRDAIKGSPAMEKWSKDYFIESYGNESVIVREIIDEDNGEIPVVRLQLRTFEDFYVMKDKGRNVSIIASSSIFSRKPAFLEEMRASMEDDLVGLNGEKVMVDQFFVTDGGRSWYHSEIGVNLNRQVIGYKRWTLVSPAENFWLCPKPVISGTSVNADCLLKMSIDQREAYMKKMKRVTTLLGPGDLIVNPPWYWHDVQSIGTTNDESISVAGRIKCVGPTFANSPMSTFVALLTQITTGVKNGGSDMHLTLEKNILDSWKKDCESKGRIDCITDI